MFKQCNIQNEKVKSIEPLFLGNQDCEPSYKYGPAVRMYWLIHYVVSGKGKYRVGQSEYEISAGQAFVIKPGEITEYEADAAEPWNYIWFGFSCEKKMFSRLPYVIDRDDLRTVMRHFDYSTLESGVSNELYSVSKIWEVINCLSEYAEAREEISYSTLAMNIFRKNYMYKISVSSIAESLGLDRSYFSNLFKSDTGRSPNRYILELRMEKALELLSFEKYSVSVIAVSVGYKDLFSFSRAFKNYYGVPPQKFHEIKKLPDKSETMLKKFN